MTLFNVNKNVICEVVDLQNKNYKTKIRLMELGIVPGVKIRVVHRSIFKKTMLVVFNSSCFTIKDNLSKEIVVKNA